MTRTFRLVPFVKWRIVEVMELLVLGLLAAWLSYVVSGQREQLLLRQTALIRAPEVVAAHRATQVQLEMRTHDIERIAAFVVHRQNVGDVVGAMEAAAVTQGIKVEITHVQEVEQKTEGPLTQVQITLVGMGAPVSLLRYVHELEHLPYLVSVPKWRLTVHASNVPVQQDDAGVAPRRGPSGDIPVADHQSLLEAQALLSIEHD